MIPIYNLYKLILGYICMETIILSIYVLCTLTSIPFISLGSDKKKINKVKNMYDSYNNGYNFDTREGYPY